MDSAVRPSNGRSRDGVDVATDWPTAGAARLRQDSAPLWIAESDCFGGGEYRCASPWLPALSQVTNETEGTVNLLKLSCGTGMVGPGGSVCVACVRPPWRCR